ncbi:hypothetical protein [Kingella oralis]|jgi:hypothetical protein|nr:hypothetical protein [Kingella oralis]
MKIGFSGYIKPCTRQGSVWIRLWATARRVLARRGYAKMRLFLLTAFQAAFVKLWQPENRIAPFAWASDNATLFMLRQPENRQQGFFRLP